MRVTGYYGMCSFLHELHTLLFNNYRILSHYLGRTLSHFIAQMVSRNGFGFLLCISNYRLFIAFYRILKRTFSERVRIIYRILSHKCRKSRI